MSHAKPKRQFDVKQDNTHLWTPPKRWSSTSEACMREDKTIVRLMRNVKHTVLDRKITLILNLRWGCAQTRRSINIEWQRQQYYRMNDGECKTGTFGRHNFNLNEITWHETTSMAFQGDNSLYTSPAWIVTRPPFTCRFCWIAYLGLDILSSHHFPCAIHYPNYIQCSESWHDGLPYPSPPPPIHKAYLGFPFHISRHR